MERRDFLKYFGIGASVVPLVDGMPRPEVVAKLIEEPKADVQVIPQMPNLQALNLLKTHQPLDMEVWFVSPERHTCVFRARTFLIRYSVSGADYSLDGNRYNKLSPEAIRWKLEGQLQADLHI